jgi:hypothetical protein
VSTIGQKFAALFRKGESGPSCDTCAYVEFFRSNGDGQVTRVHAFCRCPLGPFEDRPVPRERYCERWQRADKPPIKPKVGDPTLTV